MTTPLDIVVGQEFGKWKVIALDGGRAKDGHRQVVCQCACGRIRHIPITLLHRGKTSSCQACFPRDGRHKPLEIHPGETYEKWQVVEVPHRKNRHGHQLIVCRCVCGTVQDIPASVLVRKTNKGCHACRQEKKPQHGHNLRGKMSTTYQTWANMLSRCRHSGRPDSPYYKDKGITVCERWNDFENFLADMGEKPDKSYTIERRDVAQGYNPENCYWLPKPLQARNRSDTVMLTLHGESAPLATWAERVGIPQGTLKARKEYGWSDEKTLMTPIRFTRRWHTTLSR